ncbi:MAG: hypothetical protein ACYTA5_09650 [Planctomycetota bacterium]
MRQPLWIYIISVLILGVPAYAVCTITGNATINCNGIVYRAIDNECVHYVDLTAHNAAHPDIPLPDLKKTIADNYGTDAVPQPVIIELTDYVDCVQTDHNFSDANIIPEYVQGYPVNEHPNLPSRLMNISGKTFRVTAAPTDGFDTMYYTYDVTTGGVAGVPHLLVAESSNDQERYTSLSIHHYDPRLYSHPDAGPLPTPHWSDEEWASPYTGEPTLEPWGSGQNFQRTQQGVVFSPDVGVTIYTGREIPVDNQPFNISMIFHPKQTSVRVIVSSLGCNLNRSSTDGGAVSQMWVFKFVDAMSDRFPVLDLPNNPDQRRRIGIYMTHPWYFYGHYGTPARLLQHRQEGLQRLIEYLKYCGFNYIVFNAVNGADRSEKTWYDGGAHFDWNSAGDLLVELPPIAEAAGIELLPLVTSLKDPTHAGGLSFSSDSYQMGTDGDYTRAFNNPTLDPLRPEVQQLAFNLLSEIASRTQSSSAIRGIGIRVNGKIGTCYTADQDGWRGAKLSGYSVWDLQQFKNDTSSGVPTSPPDTAYNWLQARPAEWEAWINWRCVKTREFWLACRDLIRGYRSDWILYLQCNLPSEIPGTNIEWENGESPYNLLRHHGYDPDMFAGDTGIVITRGMMVALDRFKHSNRWADPWGTNYQNYKLFHYAPGLVELYRTAEGRSCEFYQEYWEEAFNPYMEFGFPPGDWFRTTTPAAVGRNFYEGPTMSLRRHNSDTMTFLGWNRPTLGHEIDLRKFACAFRALPAVEPVPFDGTIDPVMDEVVARWHANRLAVINDTNVARTITLNFNTPVSAGYELLNVITGHVLITAHAAQRSMATLAAGAYSLNVLQINQWVPGDYDHDGDVDITDYEIFHSCASGPNVPHTGDCIKADFDNDNDVDQNDFAIFQQCYSGQGNPADSSCVD